jgi:hypothetical protein
VHDNVNRYYNESRILVGNAENVRLLNELALQRLREIQEETRLESHDKYKSLIQNVTSSLGKLEKQQEELRSRIDREKRIKVVKDIKASVDRLYRNLNICNR